MIDRTSPGGIVASATGSRALVRPVLRRVVRTLASLRLTSAILALLLALLAAQALGIASGATGLRSAALAALAVNVVACLAHRRRAMWRKPALAAFHVSIIAILALGAWGRMTFYRSVALVAEGHAVRLRNAPSERGPWAPVWVEGAAVFAGDIETTYWSGDTTRSATVALRLYAEDREVYRTDAGPSEPMSYRGVRFHVTTNMGFAARFSFAPDGGASTSGLLYFPEYRSNPDQQVETMTVPGLGAEIDCRLAMPSLVRTDEPWRLEVPASARVRVVAPELAIDRPLAVGDTARIADGTLRLDRIMPYAKVVIDYDPTAPWLLGIALLAPLVLVWHFVSSRRGRPGDV